MKSLAVKVKKKMASAVHAFLKEEKVFSKNLQPSSEGEFVFFPVDRLSGAQKNILAKKFGAKIVETDFKEQPKAFGTLKEGLLEKLSKEELLLVNRAFDLVGDIAILEIPKELEAKEKIIANALLEMHSGVKTVCKKTGAHSGVFRIEPVKVIAGKKNLTATYKESGCTFKVSLGKVFFSPRLASERLRIAKQVKTTETIAVLFAGVGPFAVVLVKRTPVAKIFAVELNPHAFRELKENIALNGMQLKIEPLFGDVKKIVPEKLAGKCDRVLMPLPKGAEEFLKEAFLCLKKQGGVVHFYSFGPKDEPFKKAVESIKKTAKELGRKTKILEKKELRDYSKSTIQIVIDFRVY